MESLDLVTGTGEEARTWITGLRYLMAGISDEDSLAKRQRTRDQYPYFTFSVADVSLFQRPLCSPVIYFSNPEPNPGVNPPPPFFNL